MSESTPIIIIDTREKDPFPMHLHGVAVSRRKLDTGDYSVVGRESELALERKSLDDFVGTMMKHLRARRQGTESRWAREVERLKLIPRRVVAIETGIGAIEMHLYKSKVNPAAVLAYIRRLIEVHQIPVEFIGNRPTSTRWALEWLLK